jgi:hypothetical protein
MTEIAPVDTPVAIDRVDRARGDDDGIRLRLTGRWLRSDQAGEQDPLLVIHLQGRRHRFPASRGQGAQSLLPGAWEATFAVPAWAEPRQEGQAGVWVGNAVVPVPLAESGAAGRAAPASTRPPRSTPPPPLAMAPPPPAMAPPTAVAPPPAAAPAGPPQTSIGTGHVGAVPEPLCSESVSALHLELEQRSAETARLRGSLADAQSDLEARRVTQTSLESAHRELRGQIQELVNAVAAQRLEFEQRLADLTGARDAEAGEAAALRDRLGAVSWAQQQRADELAGLREQLATAQVSRDVAGSEVAALRSELTRLGTELAVSREQLSAQGGDLGEAQRLLADARALTEQLRGQSSQ